MNEHVRTWMQLETIILEKLYKSHKNKRALWPLDFILTYKIVRNMKAETKLSRRSREATGTGRREERKVRDMRTMCSTHGIQLYQNLRLLENKPDIVPTPKVSSLCSQALQDGIRQHPTVSQQRWTERTLSALKIEKQGQHMI